MAHEGLELRVTVSVGVASIDPATPGTAESIPSGLLTRADEALYRANRAARNRVESAGRKAAGAATSPA